MKVAALFVQTNGALYAHGNRPPDLDWTRKPGTHQVGHFDIKKPVLSKKAASATPPAFRDALIQIALTTRTKE